MLAIDRTNQFWSTAQYSKNDFADRVKARSRTSRKCRDKGATKGRELSAISRR